VRLDPAAFRPSIRLVVVIDIGNQQACIRFVDDQPQIAANPYRPKICVFGAFDAVE
jgi:hypothetical protein